jgi:uncharacterized phage protein gp47/JayE
MPVILSKRDSEILNNLLSDITNSTSITFTSPGSRMRVLSQAFSNELSDLNLQKDIDLVQAFVASARDEYLDYIGEMLNLPRLTPETAEVSSLNRIVKFYVASGTFGDINGSSSILVPAGVRISTGVGGTTGIVYKVKYDTLLQSTDSEQYIAVEAVSEGSRANIGSNRLKYHNFNGYADSSNTTLLVTNESAISSGQDIEDNENYRYRLSKAIVANEGANETAIRVAVLNTPGVADLVFIQFTRGIGTFDVIIKSIAPITPPNLLVAIDEKLSTTEASGIYSVVRGPKNVGISMKITLKSREVLTASEQSSIIENIQRALTSYLNNLDIGKDFVINEVVQRVMEIDDRIKDMGSPTKPIDELYIWKDSRLEDGRVRQQLLTNYTPFADERIIVETEGTSSDPIQISFVEG